MNILIITHYFPPLNAMGTNRLYAFAKEWTKDGHYVTILTTKKYLYDGKTNLYPKDPYYPKMEIIELPYAKWFTRYFEISNPERNPSNNHQKFYLIRLLIRKIRQKIIGLIFDIHDLWISTATQRGIELLSSRTYDFVLSSYSPPATHAVASKLKKRYPSLYWVADYRDLWSANPYYQNSNIFSKWQEKKEKKLLQSADLITTVSSPWKVYLENFLEKETLLIPNGYDADELKIIPNDRLYPHDCIRRFVYTGTLYPKKQNVIPLFRILKKLKDKKIIEDNFQLLFYGDSGEIDDLIKKFDLNDIVFKKGFINREVSLQAQRDADGLVYFGWEDKNAISYSSAGVLSAKVFEYIASGTEIFAIGGRKDSEASQYILQTKSGNVYEDNEELIFQNFKRVILEGKKKMQPDETLLNSIQRDTRAKQLLSSVKERLSRLNVYVH